ncbi:MAG: hypothetical protein PHN66_03450 [Candidatus Shapirobacteria bacterium]|nr:hypothetical protein [Candidatus Shapirobacteria bacterium]
MLENFFRSTFPDLEEYKERPREYFRFISFICSFGEILLAISNKDNHIYDLFFLNPPYILNIERQLKIYSLNPFFVEYQKNKTRR